MNLLFINLMSKLKNFLATADILDGIGDVIESVVGWLVSLFNSVVAIFWKEGTSGTAGNFTFIGVMLLVAFGLSMVWVLINFIKSLVKRG